MDVIDQLLSVIPSGYQYAFATVISGVGFATIFPVLPTVLVELFSNMWMRFFVTVMLLWQAGRTMQEALVSSALVWGLVMYLNSVEESEKNNVKANNITQPQQ